MGSKRKQKENAPSTTLSAEKRILYRSECINQLDKWHDLLEKGVISSAQFTELQETIIINDKALLIDAVMQLMDFIEMLYDN